MNVPYAKNAVEVLERATELLADHKNWTRHTFSRDIEGRMCEPYSDQATCFCVLGALERAGRGVHDHSIDLLEDPDYHAAISAEVAADGYITEVIKARYRSTSIPAFNDNLDILHIDVVSVMNQALADARKDKHALAVMAVSREVMMKAPDAK